MPRTPGIRRYIFNTLTVLNLLLLLATVGLWVHSYWYELGAIYKSPSYRIYFSSSYGQTGLAFDARKNRTEGWTLLYRNPGVLTSENTPQSALEFSWRWDKPGGVRASHIVGPHWFLTLIFAIGPAIWLFKWNKRRKLGPNACPFCGYDLTGNESGVCPECGGKAMLNAD